MAEHGRYLFAVARDLDPTDLAAVPGLRTAPLAVVEHRGLQAVVCDVDLDEFGEEALLRNLEDLDWLEEVARGHDEVVRGVARSTTVAPMRLVTICSTDDSVRDRIEHLHDDLVAVLDRIEGRREWSVKAYAVPAKPQQDPEPGTREPTSGAAYLQRKRQQANRRRAASERSMGVADEVHASLAAHAVAGRRLQPQDPRLSGRTETMILNAAYLVPDDEGEAFAARVADLDRGLEGVTVELQGPWPPYSFAALD